MEKQDKKFMEQLNLFIKLSFQKVLEFVTSTQAAKTIYLYFHPFQQDNITIIYLVL